MAWKKRISNAVARVVSNQQTSLDEDTSQTLLFLKNFVTLPVVLLWVAQWLTPGPSSQTTGSQGNESTSKTNCYQETEVQQLSFPLRPQKKKTPNKQKEGMIAIKMCTIKVGKPQRGAGCGCSEVLLLLPLAHWCCAGAALMSRYYFSNTCTFPCFFVLSGTELIQS